MRAIPELANRIEGRTAQAIAVNLDAKEGLAEAIAKARKRVANRDSTPRVDGASEEVTTDL